MVPWGSHGVKIMEKRALKRLHHVEDGLVIYHLPVAWPAPRSPPHVSPPLLPNRSYTASFNHSTTATRDNTHTRHTLWYSDRQTTPPNTTPLRPIPSTMVLGKVAHYAFDAVLISAFLAGVRRSTGLTPSLKPDSFSENPSALKWFENYLWVGETVMDQSVALFGASSYFERKR